MKKYSELKEYLMDKQILTEEEILKAEDYALTRKISLERSLIFLNLIGYERLGNALAAITARAYQPLLNSPPPDHAKSKVPVGLADRYMIFPVAYNLTHDLLTLACSEKGPQLLMDRLAKIFPTSLRLEFTVASDEEIEKAIDRYYRGKSIEQSTELEIPHEFTVLMSDQIKGIGAEIAETRPSKKKIILLEPDIKRAGALKTFLKHEGHHAVHWLSSLGELAVKLREHSFDLLIINGRHFPPGGSWVKAIPGTIELPPISYYNPATLLTEQEYPYQQMSGSLISLASAFVRKDLKNEPSRIHDLLAIVRYCKLMALRLDLRPPQVDSTVLAAWLSTHAKDHDLLKQIVTPFNLEEIMYPLEDDSKPMRVEAAILRLVQYYQILKKNNPNLMQDMDGLRRQLIKNLPSAGFESYLEVFLSLLKNEEFLKDLDKPEGSILIVDNGISQTSHLTIRLNNDGYDVEIVPDGGTAFKKLSENNVDLVISEATLPGMDGLEFCRRIRTHASTADIPFFFLTGEEGSRLPAECLAAGADDFIKKPVDLEILSLKIQRTLATRTFRGANSGVSGSLNELSATDFIQSLSAGDKSVKITIENGTESGHIYIEKGNIIHAKTGALEGNDAFFRSVAWEEGRFQIVPCTTFPARTIHGRTMALLMDAARLADEARAGENEV